MNESYDLDASSISLVSPMQVLILSMQRSASLNWQRWLPNVHPKTLIFGFKLSAVSIQLSAKVLHISQLAEC